MTFVIGEYTSEILNRIFMTVTGNFKMQEGEDVDVLRGPGLSRGSRDPGIVLSIRRGTKMRLQSRSFCSRVGTSKKETTGFMSQTWYLVVMFDS